MPVVSPHADEPIESSKSGPGRPLDLHDSSAEEMLGFLKRQPAKYFYSFIGVLATLAVAVAGATWFLASSTADSKIAVLSSELSAANRVTAFLQKDLQGKAIDQQNAQQLIQSLQSALAEKDRKLAAAQGCESIRADFRRVAARAVVLNQKAVIAQGVEKQKIDGESDVLEGEFLVLKGSMEACASR